MKLRVAMAGAIIMLAFLSACEFKSPADRVNEAVDELIEDSVEDVFGTPTPQSGGVPAPPARNAPTEASSGAAGPKIEPTGDSGPTATPQSMVKDVEGGPGAGADGASLSFASVSAGEDHTCGVRRDGSIACWGNDEYSKATPPEGRFASVSAGGDHTCGVKEDGTVACWGTNMRGEVTPPEGRFVLVDAGLDHTCGVRDDGTVAC